MNKACFDFLKITKLKSMIFFMNFFLIILLKILLTLTDSKVSLGSYTNHSLEDFFLRPLLYI